MVPAGSRHILGQVARHGAAVLFSAAVARLFEEVTGEKAKAPVSALIERLADEDRLSPEALLHLTAAALALERAGAGLLHLAPPLLQGLPESIHEAAAGMRDRLRPAPEGFERLVRLGSRMWGGEPQWWKG